MYPDPLDDAALAAAWDAAWSTFGRKAPAGLRAELMAAWSEPNRHYRDQRHLRECLALWARWRAHGQRPGEVAIALWFHDARCDPRSNRNELSSAAWAARSVVQAGADSNAAQRIYDLIVATEPGASAAFCAGQDARLLLDIDLAILGSPAERFEQYDQDVRKEYAWMPGFCFRIGRARALQGFLDRPRIYRSDAPAAQLEAQARLNLAVALSRRAQ